MKFTTNVRIDIALITICTLLISSGIGVHVTEESSQHETWHNWAVVHVISATLFLVFGLLHINGHRAWFKSLAKTLKKKSKPNMILSLLFLLETVTGIILLAFVNGGNSDIGLWHWWGGLIMAVFGIGHILKRRKMLRPRKS